MAISLKLSASEMNALMDKLEGISDRLPFDLQVDRYLKHSMASGMGFRVIDKGNTIFYIADTTKDSRSKNNECTIPYIRDAMSLIFEHCESSQSKDKELKYIFPMVQCRGMLKLPPSIASKMHFVLLEVGEDKRLTIHDSQSSFKNAFYPDKFKHSDKLKALIRYNSNKDYLSHAKQDDDILCGYYAHQYALAILDGRSCDRVKIKIKNDAIVVTIIDNNEKKVSKEFKNKEDYFAFYKVEINYNIDPDPGRSLDDGGSSTFNMS